jgi:GH15 family glucan-1,4-alpha-glucosidase
MALRIEDYALIGDCESAALVGKDGSIDWLCLPRFDSPACFSALLGGPENGRWKIAPKSSATEVERRYRGDTMILDTEFLCATGRCRVTDFMPVRDSAPSLVRIVTGLEGRVRMRMELAIRFDYGRLVPWVSRRGEDLVAIAGSEQVVLRAPVTHRGEGMTTVAEFDVSAGESVTFTLVHAPSHLPPPEPQDPRAALEATERFWRSWCLRGTLDGPWRDAVVRSLLTLKALTYAPTGGMVAAPTTSLPEQMGGTRNWDYRFCWLRDATFVLLTMMQAGYRKEAEAWRAWLVRSVAGLPSQLQPLYSVTGDHRLDELELPWLAGHQGTKPVRIGNAAYRQTQLDVFGEVLDALHHARRHGMRGTEVDWALEKALLQHLETLAGAEDRGIWEVRGPTWHFTHSKVMIWVAFDRAISAVKDFGLDGPVKRWRKIRDALHAEICEKAFDPELGAFVQAYGSKQLDAATLLLPHVGFLPATDPRMVGTVAAIQKRLARNGLIDRYDTAAAPDGLPPGEGSFLACSFWLVDNLVLQGRLDEGRELFEHLLTLRNDVGLLAEEYDPVAKRQLGNFPQALSHLALVDSAFNLARFKGPARERSKHQPK